jgi:hypothetical protein
MYLSPEQFATFRQNMLKDETDYQTLTSQEQIQVLMK